MSCVMHPAIERDRWRRHPHPRRRPSDDLQPHGSQAHCWRALPVLWRRLSAVGENAVLSAVDLLRYGLCVVSRRRALPGRARTL